MRKKDGPLFHSPQRKGLDYTKRQLDILDDKIPLSKITTTELTKLIRRASERGDEISLDIARCLYEAKKHPNNYEPQISLIEAKAILQRLTPWTINWTIAKKKSQKTKQPTD